MCVHRAVLLWAMMVLAFVSAYAGSDPLGRALVVQSASAMGGSVPSDSIASGTLQAAGSSADDSTFQLKTRGLSQTRETIRAATGVQDRVFSFGQGSTVSDQVITQVSNEQACSFDSAIFPLRVLAASLNDPDVVFQFVGQETLAGMTTYHVRFWKSYASQKSFQTLATFSTKEIWIDATTYLPRRISFDSRSAVGGVPTTHIDVDFTSFHNYSGTLYPDSITESINGTHWGIFSVQQVAFNTGLTDNDFPMQ